eukprot:gene9839-biopygen21935
MAAAAEAAAVALPSEGQGGVHFAIPEGTTTIKGADWMGKGEESWKEWVVGGGSSLASLAIPSSATRIGGHAFYGCSALASVAVDIPDGTARLSFKDWSQSAKAKVKSISIPDSVTAIGDDASSGCTAFASLTIPASVTSIGAEAFKNCANLATVVVFRPYAGSPAVSLAALTITSNAFQHCPNIKVVSAPDVVVAALGEPYAGCSTLGALPASVTFAASKLQLETYFWSMKLHRNTSRLSARQRAWVKHLLTVGSRVRLHWKPANKGPRSVPCVPIAEHPPLPCVMNYVWLLVLEFVLLSELGALA